MFKTTPIRNEFSDKINLKAQADLDELAEKPYEARSVALKLLCPSLALPDRRYMPAEAP